MKRIDYISLLAAMAVIVSCEVSEPIRPYDNTEEDLPAYAGDLYEAEWDTLVFSSASDEDSEDSKTVYSNGTILWSAGDKIRMGYTVGGTWQGANGNATTNSPAKLYESDALSSGGETASFTVPTQFSGNVSGTYQFYTIYPSSAAAESFSSAPTTTITIPTEQTPAAASFDPKADLMVGHSVKSYTSKPTEAIPLMWERKVAHGEITLKNFNEISEFTTSEIIQSVTLTAQSSARLTGSYSLNLTTEAITPTSSSNSVTVKGDNLSWTTAGSVYNLTFWIGILPETITSLTITLETDKATYTRTFANIANGRTFLCNAHNRLPINMASATREAKEVEIPVYEKVTAFQSDWSGQYVLGYEESATSAILLTSIGKISSNTVGLTSSSITVSDGLITYDDASAYEITIAKTGTNKYSIKVGGNYLYYGGSGNQLQSKATYNSSDCQWTISYSSSTLTIKSAQTNYTDRSLQYNISDPRFACYTSSQAAISLYKLTTTTGTPTPPDPLPEATATVTTSAAGSIAQTTATLNGSYTGATGTISEVGFYWGTSSTPSTKVVSDGTSSPFTSSLSSLTANTTYYFQAYVKEYNAADGDYEERKGTVLSFTTAAPTTQYYEKVTSSLSDWSGEYLIVYESTNKAFNGGLTTLDANNNIISVTIANSKIEKTTTTQAAQFTIAKVSNGYSIKSASGYYIGTTSSNNSLSTSSSTAYVNSLTYSSGNVTIKSSYNIYLRYNTGDSRFRYYGSGQQAIQLYKLAGTSTQQVTVTTGSASNISENSATLNGSYTVPSGLTVTERGFYFGTTNNPTTIITVSGSGTSFSSTQSPLTAGTTYFFKAYAIESDGTTTTTRYGEVTSFTTTSSSGNSGANPSLQYLACYEIPHIDLANTTTYTSTGMETFGSTYWYEYDTILSTQKVVTHTYSYNGHTYRNYTALIDKNKRCALWTAYVMNKVDYPNNDVGRGKFDESTSYDPAIPNSWQSSGSTSDYNNGNGYARGHHCASEDRQTTSEANKQTFYYTNQSPQWQNSFNSGIWSNLEGAIQSNAPSNANVMFYVVVGTLFTTNNSGSSNDGGTVGRPSHFYKLVMKCTFSSDTLSDETMTDAKGIAYIYTNEAHSGTLYYNSNFITTIDDIEQRSGFDFFANVPTALQDAAERTATQLWTY